VKIHRLFTVEDGRVSEGALVQSFTLSSGVEIDAILIGESGRGRSLGVLPVQGARPNVTLDLCQIGTTRAGRPKLIAAFGTPSDDKVILVLRTSIGFRGGNAHTGDRTGLVAREDWDGNPTFDYDGMLEWGLQFAERPGSVLSEGRIAQGDAGRMGSGDQLVLVLEKNQVLRIARSGRLYGAPSAHYLVWNGEKILIATWEERELTDLF
jgi:hypothetical protein